jgi:hypothetical protein
LCTNSISTFFPSSVTGKSDKLCALSFTPNFAPFSTLVYRPWTPLSTRSGLANEAVSAVCYVLSHTIAHQYSCKTLFGTFTCLYKVAPVSHCETPASSQTQQTLGECAQRPRKPRTLVRKSRWNPQYAHAYRPGVGCCSSSLVVNRLGAFDRSRCFHVQLQCLIATSRLPHSTCNGLCPSLTYKRVYVICKGSFTCFRHLASNHLSYEKS